jgi:hypothetical protein
MAMLLYRRQRKTWEDTLRQSSKEKRSKSLKNAELVRRQNGKSNEELEGRRAAGPMKKRKTSKPKSSMFDNCS